MQAERAVMDRDGPERGQFIFSGPWVKIPFREDGQALSNTWQVRAHGQSMRPDQPSLPPSDSVDRIWVAHSRNSILSKVKTKYAGKAK